MKKKITLLLTLTMAVTTLLAGCGKTDSNSGEITDAEEVKRIEAEEGNYITKTKGEITVSEMLENVLEENDNAAIIYTRDTDVPKPNLTSNTKVVPHLFDGKTLELVGAVAKDKSNTLGQYESGEVDAKTSPILYKLYDHEDDTDARQVYAGLVITADENDDSKIIAEEMCFDTKYGVNDTNTVCSTNHYVSQYTFGFSNFSRIKIDDDTYMMFTSYSPLSDEDAPKYHQILIKDTDYTKNKAVVFDTKEKDGVRLRTNIEYVAGWYTIEKIYNLDAVGNEDDK